MEVEDQVELAHVAEVAIEHFDEVMNDVEYDQFVVGLLDTAGEVERCVSMDITICSIFKS